VASTVVFYDGVCALCNRLVRFLIRRDTHARLLFAPLQGTLAREVLPAHGYHPTDLDTVYVLANFRRPIKGRPTTDVEPPFAGRQREPAVLARSRAILHALAELGPAWRALATMGRLVPRPVSDALYDAIARRRYGTFGKYDACPIPPPEWRGRFIE
jgi:predicted DCC family thiol-disulfide oxidoreductase YuxK